MGYTLDDLRRRLAALDARVEDAEAVYQMASAQLAHAQALRDGAEALIDELAAEEDSPYYASPSAPAPVRKGSPVNGVTALVEDILREHPTGIDIHQVQKIATERGHDLNGEQVRSAITYLRRRGDAENIARGVWRLKVSNSTSPVVVHGGFGGRVALVEPS